MRHLSALLLLIGATLSAQTSFTEYYGYPDDRAQEVGLLAVPDGEELLVVGMVEEIPEGGPGLTFLRTRKSDGTILSREFLSSDLHFYDARAHGSARGDFLVSSRIGGNLMALSYFSKQGTPVWSREIDLGSPNANRALLVGTQNAAFQFYEPTVNGITRSLLRNFTASGELGWEIVLTPEDAEQSLFDVVIDELGHPVALTVGPTGFLLQSFHRLSGEPRWEQRFTEINSLSYPLQVKLVVDQTRDRILVVGASSSEFEQVSRITAISFDYNGNPRGDFSLGERRYLQLNIQTQVTPAGELIILDQCQGIRWPDYENSSDYERFSLCQDLNRVNQISTNYQRQNEIYLTGAQRQENGFDHDLIVSAASEEGLLWTHTEGRAGRQDEEYPVAAGPAPGGSGYYFLASVPRPNSKYEAQLTKVDATGVVQWQRVIALSETETSYGRGLQVLRNGNVLVSATGFRRAGDFIFSPLGELVTGQDGLTNFHHRVRSRSFPQELSDGTILTHEGLGIAGGSDRVMLYEYDPTNFSTRAFHEIAGFPTGELTGLTDLKDGTVLLLGRPTRELSTVKVLRYDLNTRSESWSWESGSSGIGAREIDGAVSLPNGEVILAIRGSEIDQVDETSTGFIRLVRLSEDGREMDNRRFPEATTNVLQPFSMALAENGDLLLLGKNPAAGNQLQISRFDPVDLSLRNEQIHNFGAESELDLAQSQYLGNGSFLFFGSTFAPERLGQQLFLSIANTKDLSTSTFNHYGFSEQIHVYPNPTADQLELKLSFPEARPLYGRLYNAQGSLIDQWSRSASTIHQQQMDLANLPAGSYLLQLTDGEVTGRKWFIKK